MWTLDAEIRRRYVQGMVCLGVWYVRLLWERGEIGAEEVPLALCQRVDLYRFTDLWQGAGDAHNGTGNPAWMELANTLAALIRSTTAQDELEERALALLGPTLEARLPKDVGPPPVRPFECWTYELGWPGQADRPGLWGKLRNPAHLLARLRKTVGLPPPPSRHGVLHIMNVVVPRSPMDDIPRLAETLRKLIAEVRTRHPQVQELWCNTWLNDHPKFAALFPAAWRESAVVAPLGNYRNWWGQFARRDGDFNEAAARQFQDSGGVFRYRALQCHAPLEEIDAHLRQLVARPGGS